MGGRGLSVGLSTGAGGGSAEAQMAGGGGEDLDALSESLFGKADFTVKGYGKAEKAYLRKIFGHSISSEELGKMVGALDGSTVTVTFNKSAVGKVSAFKVEIEHPYISKAADEGMTRYIYQKGSEVGIYNATFYVNKAKAPSGLGSRVFANQAYNARENGVAFIRTYALGAAGIKENGAYTWIRLGYDAPLPRDVQARLFTAVGKPFRNARTFNQLMAKGGAEWWRANSSPQDVVFDLNRGSTSLRILNAYIRGRGIKLGRRAPKTY